MTTRCIFGPGGYLVPEIYLQSDNSNGNLEGLVCLKTVFRYGSAFVAKLSLRHEAKIKFLMHE